MNTALFNFMLRAEANAAGADTAQTSPAGMILYYVFSFGLIIVLFYFLAIRPQKKKEKEAKILKDNLQVGDEVVTIGGITGIIVRINRNAENPHEDSAVIETGGDRSKIRVMIWAISENKTLHDAPEEAVSKK